MSVVVAHGAYTVLGVGVGRWDWVTSQWTPVVTFATCACVSLVRGLTFPPERRAWFALAAGLGSYSLGTALLAVVKVPVGFPSATDLLSWGLYPAALAAIWLVAHTQLSRPRADVWLDGVIGGLATASLGVVLIFGVVIDPLASLRASPGNVVYVLGDLLAVGFGIGACALMGWRPPRALIALIIGFTALGIDDTLFLASLLQGSYAPAGPLDTYWQFSVVVIAAAAAWSPPFRRVDPPVSSTSVVGFPFVFALIAVGLAGYNAVSHQRNLLATVLTVLTLIAVVARFALTARAHLAMIDVTERAAVTDVLTGLGNRRKLIHDAERLFAEATDERPVLFALFDLDGLKAYNDTHGHPAGDDLLARLGAKLTRAMGTDGSAYRIGGDEFCVLFGGEPHQHDDALVRAAEALTDGIGSSAIGSCHGTALVPVEAFDTESAMQLADQRLYHAKSRRVQALGYQVRTESPGSPGDLPQPVDPLHEHDELEGGQPPEDGGRR